jgi:hypothetical protein
MREAAMKAARGRWIRIGRFLGVLVLLAGLVQGQPQAAKAAANRVAYIYGSSGNPTAVAVKNQFVSMLNAKGLAVDAYDEIQAGNAVTDLSVVDAIILADDAGAAGILDSNAFNKIQSSGKPVVGIGQGGMLFFNQAGLTGVTSGLFSTGATNAYIHAVDPYAPIWSSPDQILIPTQDAALYLSPASVYAFQAINTVQYVTRIGRLPGVPNFYSVIAQSQGGRCYTYFGYREVPALQSATSLFLNLLEGSPCTQGTYALRSVVTSTAPTMDGIYSYGEWPIKSLPNTNFLRMDHGFLVAMNDSLRLYLLLDVLEAGTANPLPNPADLMVSFDVNNDGLITPGVDKNFATQNGTYNLRYQTYNGPANWNPPLATSMSSLGPGFDCFPEDGTKVLQLGPPASFSCAAHQIFEVAIDLSEIGILPTQALQTIHLGIRTRTPAPNIVDEVPNAFVVDFSNLITLQMNLGSIPHDPGASIQFTSPAFEITQVIQTPSNSVPLVAEKVTAGRVSVKEIGSPNSQPYLAFLYGQRGVNDLPGSPLMKLMNAPPSVDRGKLDDTANFNLPASWTTPGEVTFHAEARDFNGNTISSGYQLLTFQHKQKPVYWIIRQNMAAPNATPDLMDQSSLDAFMSYARTVFPVPDITFSQKYWTTFGALNNLAIEKNVDLVQKLYSQVSASYWNAIQNNQPPPFALPDQIFGARTGGGGLSDPTWGSSGAGRATAGGNSATSLEGVLAHEFNHNLDRSSNGTWGRHVNACGASGPDPQWPYGSSFTIQEYGFDTRLPWQTSIRKTVIPNTVPDLMSYCQSGIMPTKWVSPYRYNAWFGSAQFPANAPVVHFKEAPIPSNSVYINGSVSANGTAGQLDPLLFAAGLPITPSAAGVYSLTLSGPPGTPTVTHFFDLSFTDTEGNPRATVYFSFVLPDTGGITSLQLKNGAVVLATITKSAAAPVAGFTNPSGPATLSGTQTVTWTVSDTDTPLANLSQALLYSADNGATWIPVSTTLPGTVTSYALDTNLLPKSTSGKLRLWVSDGLNSITVESSGTLTVGNHPPTPHIAAPLNGIFIPSGTTMMFQGWADDVDTSTLTPDGFLWTLDGMTTVIGIGNSVQATLPNGVHTVLLTTVDADGAYASTSITVYVQVYQAFLPAVQK